MLTSMNERAIREFEVRTYRDPIHGTPNIGNYFIERGFFEEACYQHFAVDELIVYLKKNPQFDIITGTVMFRQKALRMCDRAKIGSDPCHLFAVMYDTMSEVLDFLLSRKEVR